MNRHLNTNSFCYQRVTRIPCCRRSPIQSRTSPRRSPPFRIPRTSLPPSNALFGSKFIQSECTFFQVEPLVRFPYMKPGLCDRKRSSACKCLKAHGGCGQDALFVHVYPSIYRYSYPTTIVIYFCISSVNGPAHRRGHKGVIMGSTATSRSL